MPIVKEYFTDQIEMRGPGTPNARPWVSDGATCILRFDDGQKLTLPKLAKLFNAAAKDYPALKPASIIIANDHIEFYGETPKPDYKKLPPKTIGARG